MEAYQSMMDYSGKLSDDLSLEIERRGGMLVFKEKIHREEIYQREVSRVRKEVRMLAAKETEPEFIMKLVSSDILTETEMNELVRSTYSDHMALLQNKAITPKTFTGSIIGGIAGTIVSGMLMWKVLGNEVWYMLYLLVPAYWLNYGIIYLITRQTRSNFIIFLTAFIATITSALFALFLIRSS